MKKKGIDDNIILTLIKLYRIKFNLNHIHSHRIIFNFDINIKYTIEFNVESYLLLSNNSMKKKETDDNIILTLIKLYRIKFNLNHIHSHQIVYCLLIS